MLCLPETACTNFSTCACKGLVDYKLNLEVCFVFIMLTGVWQNQCSNSEETDILLFFFIFYLSQFLDIFDFYTIHPSFLLLKCPVHLQWQHFELHAWHEFQYFIIESFTVLHNYNTVLNLTGFLLVSCNSWKFCLLFSFFWIDLHEYTPILHTSSLLLPPLILHHKRKFLFSFPLSLKFIGPMTVSKLLDDHLVSYSFFDLKFKLQCLVSIDAQMQNAVSFPLYISDLKWK